MNANAAHFNGNPIQSDKHFSPLSPAGYMLGAEMIVSKQHQTTLKIDHVKINCNEVKRQHNELIKVLSNNHCKLFEIDSQLTEVG